ncbi:MAG TPA: GNAT family N-acetyltransferase [Anaerolineales bacterium]|nr:GNAT family N-acetyltransferase [Anaerolineales bacterium]
MIIEIILRDVTESDLPIFYEQQLDPEATQMAAFPSRDRESFMAHWAKIMADDSNILKTILFQDQVAGNIVSWGQASEREVGYWLGRNFWGKGIATKALTEFLIIEKIRPLVAHVVKHNIGSRRVLEKCGFTLSKEEIEEVILKLV